MRPWVAALALALAVAAGSLITALTLGPGYVGYDAAWSLVWGDQLAHGNLPDYRAPFAPTPHPLANLAAAPLSLFADGGIAALAILTYVAFAALLAGVIVIGERLVAWPAGVVAAVIVATFGVLDREVAFSSSDIPYLALIAWAGALEAAKPKRGTPVQVCIGLAGLLRPEAWLLGIAYLAWLRTRAPRAVALAIAAPVLWGATDLVVTGNPLFSLTGTQALAADLGRPTGLRTAIVSAPDLLADLMGTLPLIAGVVGLVGGAIIAPRRFAGPVAVLVAGLVTFALLGAAELPVLLRYLLLPACVLALAAGLAVALPHLTRRAVPISAVVAGLLVAAVPATLGSVQDARDFTRARRATHADLLAAARTPAFHAAAQRCPLIVAPDFRARPLLALTNPESEVTVGNLPDGQPGLLLTYATERARRIFTLGAPGEVRRQAAPAGAQPIARNASWVAYAVC